MNQMAPNYICWVLKKISRSRLASSVFPPIVSRNSYARPLLPSGIVAAFSIRPMRFAIGLINGAVKRMECAAAAWTGQVIGGWVIAGQWTEWSLDSVMRDRAVTTTGSSGCDSSKSKGRCFTGSQHTA